MEDIRKMLEEANKLIFIRKYEQAASILDRALQTDHGCNDLLIHLRRIELGNRLNQLETLHQHYISLIRDHKLEPMVGELCLTLLEQQGDLISPSAAIKKFKEIIQKKWRISGGLFWHRLWL